MAKRWLIHLALCAAAAVSQASAASPLATEAAHGMVVSAQHLATDAGVEILRQGGNAIDAAVAVGYAEAVTNPCCGNIGGGGFLTAHLADGRDIFINFRETAPAASTPTMYLDAAGKPVPGASLIGWKAVAVPGTVLGLDTALRKYGTISREQAMAPAIRLARDGFILERGDTDIIDSQAAKLRRDPAIAAIFLRRDGHPFQPGDRLSQPALAATLQAIANDGPDAFYKGKIPAAIEAASKGNGGIITAADLAAYTVTEAAPIACDYRGYRFMSAPPPSSGGATICEILNILEGYDLHTLGFHSAQTVHLMTEAMRHAYLDRNSYLGDPAFVENPLEHLLSKDYAAAIRGKIGDRATPSSEVIPGAAPHERTETTHYSVVDQAGNAVSVTYTINGAFGALVMGGDTGVLMNDEMDDFTIKPGVPNLFGLVQGVANAIAPGKRPLSSMAPSIVTRDGHVVFVLGSPGGARIITITLETALNLIDFGMAPREAVDAPRLHHQWLPDTLYTEPLALSADTHRILEGLGYHIEEQTPWGAAELIEVTPSGVPQAVTGLKNSGSDAANSMKLRPGMFYGANDDRRPAGSAGGY